MFGRGFPLSKALTPFFEFPEEIQKIIYTTGALMQHPGEEGVAGLVGGAGAKG